MMQINGREISSSLPPYLVAEISCNHRGSFVQARYMIEVAANCGADAVKFQVYTPAELTTPEHKELWDLYTKAQTPRDWIKPLFDYAKEVGITAFSSAFSVDGVKFLADLGAPAIKISSFEFKDDAIMQAAVDTKLPVIVSTGLADWQDLFSSHWGFEGTPYERKIEMGGFFPADVKWPDAVHLHCVSQYPSQIKNTNLRAITKMQRHINLVGLSDHTPGYETAIAATALGAVMIEKHFKLDENCIDAAYSLNPDEFSAMCYVVRQIWKGLGDGEIHPTGQPRQR